jgi:putative SOS response-associated peptidase YedK
MRAEETAMCGRFGQKATPAELAAAFGAEWLCPEPALPRFNIAPTQTAPVLLRHGTLALDVFRWGLIPGWARDPSIGGKMINARAETAAEKPSYRTALARRRCVVPASGFYEWKKTAGSKLKVPHWIFAADGDGLALAGLWESWRPDRDTAPVHTFTILTTSASQDMEGLHDRMPVILDRAGRDGWLDPAASADDLQRLMVSAPAGTLRAYAVSTAVNRPTYDGPDLIVALDERPAELPL